MAGQRSVPPQNLEAEESVLGAMMISPNAINACIDVLEPDGAAKFYRESHARIYRCAIELAAGGKPVDAITLIDALELRGELDSVGGRVRLHELAALVPASANVRHYASIVRENWVLRALIVTGGEIARLGWERPDDADVLLAQVEELVSGVRSRLQRERELTMTMYEAAEYLDAKFRDPPGEGFGIPTPWSFMPSFHGGRLYVLGGYQADGKGLALNTVLPTPAGWTTMGDVRVGDRLLDDLGQPCTVEFVSQTHRLRCFDVEFSDGSVIRCDEQHLWLTEDAQERASLSRRVRRSRKGGSYAVTQKTREPQCRTADEILATLKVGDQWNHAVLATRPLNLERQHLPIAPYTLGAWLGDGTSRSSNITPAGPEGIDCIRQDGEVVSLKSTAGTGRANTYCIHDLAKRLRALDLLGNKHVPPVYLRASYEQRLALLQGLMDTDGYVSRRGQCEFTNTRIELAEAVYELVVSLGIVTTIREGAATLDGRVTGPKWRVCFTTGLPVFRLRRKLARQHARSQATKPHRKIVAVRRVEIVSTRCLTVDSPSHLFLAGRAMIPTHNTVQGAHFFRHAVSAGVPTSFITLEMSMEDLVERLAANMGLPAKRVQAGRLLEEQKPAAARIIGDMAKWGATGRIVDAPAADVATIRRHVKLAKPKFVIVDHLQQFHLRAEYERQDLEAVVRGLWQVAREFDIAILLLAQLSRSGDKKNPYPRPTMANLRGSGMIEALAWCVFFVWRTRDERNLATDKSEFIFAKNRSGPTGIRDLVFHDRETRFSELVKD